MWYTYIYSSTYVASIAAIIGAIYLRRFSFLVWLIWVMVLGNVAVDIYATYIDRVLGKQTHLLYSVFTNIEILYILLLFSKTYVNKKHKQGVYMLCLLFITFAIINLISIQKTIIFNTYTFSLGSLIISIISYLKIRIFIIKDEIEASNMMLWFSVANFIFYSAATPVLMLSPIIRDISESLAENLFKAKDGAYIIWSILNAIGFICQKKKTI